VTFSGVFGNKYKNTQDTTNFNRAFAGFNHGNYTNYVIFENQSLHPVIGDNYVSLANIN